MNSSTVKPHACAQSDKSNIIVYGGNGFVGTHVAKCLVESKATAICLSRTGHKPIHLQAEHWSTQVCWSKGDAATPDKKLLARADCIICLVGSAPTPTFSKESFERKVFENGETNARAIEAAGEAGIKKVVLLGAQIPWPLRNNFFAYSKGKDRALCAAKRFTQLSDEHSAVVFQPGMVFGRRYLRSGKSIPLNKLVGPLPYLLPGQFVSVEKLANRIVEVALSENPYSGELTIIKNSDI